MLYSNGKWQERGTMTKWYWCLGYACFFACFVHLWPVPSGFSHKNPLAVISNIEGS